MSTIPPKTGNDDSAKLEAALATATKTENLNPTATQPPLPPTLEKVLTSDLKEKVVHKDDADIKPEKPVTREIATKNLIASALVRFPLVHRVHTEVSTFTPTAFNYFEVVHFMDKLITSNTYFANSGLPWHPFVSRLYFSVLFYLQAFRAMEYAKLGSRSTRQLISQILKDLPPERLPVPGPLLPILKALCCTQPDDKYFRYVCPQIPDYPGPRNRPAILTSHNEMLGLPNIPLLLGLANSITGAAFNEIPNYLEPASFNNTAAHEFSGFQFPEGDWDQGVRSLVCQPGMHRRPETSRNTDALFNAYGDTLDLPAVNERSELHSLTGFTQLDTVTWVENMIQTMAEYTTFS